MVMIRINYVFPDVDKIKDFIKPGWSFASK
jgi:hypothetical protein